MGSINERIKLVIDEYYEGNVSECERASGLKKDTLKNIVGGRLSKPSFETLGSIVRNIPAYKTIWLLTGEGEMPGIQHVRESDDCLYHCTKEFEGLLGILKEKIKPRVAREDFSYIHGKPSKATSGDKIEHEELTFPPNVYYPVFCLCDIPLERLSAHQEIHGGYFIGFTKEWAIRNEFNPVWYIRPESPLSKSLTKLIYYFSNEERFNSDKSEKEDKEIYPHFGIIPSFCKSYEIEGKRYYDEKEWRWMPLNTGSPLAYTTKGGNGNKKEEKEKVQSNQEKTNTNNNICLDFDIDDIAYIGVNTTKEKNDLIKSLEGLYDLEKLSKVIHVQDGVKNIKPDNKNTESAEGVTVTAFNIDFKDRYLKALEEKDELSKENRDLHKKREVLNREIVRLKEELDNLKFQGGAAGSA